MNPIILTIQVGGRSRQMSVAGMAMLLGLTPDFIEKRLSWHFSLGHHGTDQKTTEQDVLPDRVSEEGGKGGKVYVNEIDDRNDSIRIGNEGRIEIDSDIDSEKKYINNEIVVNEIDIESYGEGRGLGEETPKPVTSLPLRLAEALSDSAGLPCYQHLVQHHPADRLERALVSTLSVPSERLLKSRGAYFMGIVKKLALKESESTI